MRWLEGELGVPLPDYAEVRARIHIRHLALKGCLRRCRLSHLGEFVGWQPSCSVIRPSGNRQRAFLLPRIARI